MKTHLIQVPPQRPVLVFPSPSWRRIFRWAKPVTLVVGLPPAGGRCGGAAHRQEARARTSARAWWWTTRAAPGQHRPPAGGQGAADGTVLLLGSVGPLTIAPHLMKPPYDPFKDLAPITGGVYFPNVLVVHQGAGAKDAGRVRPAVQKEARQRGLASTGAGRHRTWRANCSTSAPASTWCMFKGRRARAARPHGERVTSYFAAPPTAMPHVETGKLIPLATIGLTRPAYLPNIPTVAERATPAFVALNWYSFMAFGQDARAAARTLEPGDRQGAQRPGVKRRAEQARPVAPPDHARRVRQLHEEGIRPVGAIVRERKITGQWGRRRPTASQAQGSERRLQHAGVGGSGSAARAGRPGSR